MRTLPQYLHGRIWVAIAIVTLTVLPFGESRAAAEQLAFNPANSAFGKVLLGKSPTVSVTVSNAGSTSVTLKSHTISNAAFTTSGLNLPLTLAAGESTTFKVKFAPRFAGAVNGQISLANTGPNSPLVMNISGEGVGAAPLLASPSAITFPGIPVGQSETAFETITNTGPSKVILSSAATFGSGFSYSGPNLPATLKPGASITFNVKFAPTSAGNSYGSMVVVSSTSKLAVSAKLSGTTSSAGQLTVTPASANFGNVTVGSSSSHTATLSARGASVTISSDNWSGSSEFSIKGLNLPLTLKANQSATFTLTFSPQSNGRASGTLSFKSNASDNLLNQSLKGTGVTAQHMVGLTWDPSTSQVSGYNVYRGNKSGGPYHKINAGLDPNTNYSDSTVQSGVTYFYVTTAVDGGGKESSYSNQVKAVVP